MFGFRLGMFIELEVDETKGQTKNQMVIKYYYASIQPAPSNAFDLGRGDDALENIFK